MKMVLFICYAALTTHQTYFLSQLSQEQPQNHVPIGTFGKARGSSRLAEEAGLAMFSKKKD